MIIPSNIFPCLAYEDAPQAIDWLERAFGFTRKLVVPGPNGTVAHSELTLGPGVIMVSSIKSDGRLGSPRNGSAQALSIYIEDPDSHHQRAVAAGAEIIQELRDEEYGSRGYMAKDPEGHIWYFGTYRPGDYWETA